MTTKNHNIESDIEKKQNLFMEKHGFYFHVIIDNDGYFDNAHTHGLIESYKHDDIQILVPLDSSTIANIFHLIVDKIKNGEKIKPYILYKNIVKNFDVTFIIANESERKVLRLILPGPDGKLGIWDIDEDYLFQYNNIINYK